MLVIELSTCYVIWNLPSLRKQGIRRHQYWPSCGCLRI